ncbi:histone methylation protein DOT1-domain-containing protein [Lipomyces mesembrius]
MSSSFFQKLGRAGHLKSAEESGTPSPSPSVSAAESVTGSPAPSSSGTGTIPVRRDVRFKTVKVSRQIQRSSPTPSDSYPSGKSYQLDILKRLNKRKKDRIAKSEKPEGEKKPTKVKREQKRRGSKAFSKAKSNKHITSDDEESEEEEEEEEEEEQERRDEDDDRSDNEEKQNSQKRMKPVDELVDESREILESSAFSKHEEVPKVLQSADVVTVDTPGYESYFPYEDQDSLYIELKYPAFPAVTERFNLLIPIKEDYDPLAEVQNIMKIVAQFFLTKEDGILIFTADLQDCIIRRIKRAIKRKSLYGLKTAIDEYNAIVEQFYDDGNEKIYRELIIKNLRNRSNMATVAHEILSHIYSRIVSPQVKELRKYTAFSNNVYGELLPAFVSRIFKELELSSHQVFFDLGSGVGNCVLQAALETGCESYGCEIMENAAELADRQAVEFHERLKLWGIKAGSVKLITGDFLKIEEIGEILKKTNLV